jgi:hypothetical protein
MHRVPARKVDDLVKALGADSGISKTKVSRICPGYRRRRIAAHRPLGRRPPHTDWSRVDVLDLRRRRSDRRNTGRTAGTAHERTRGHPLATSGGCRAICSPCAFPLSKASVCYSGSRFRVIQPSTGISWSCRARTVAVTPKAPNTTMLTITATRGTDHPPVASRRPPTRVGPKDPSP